MSTITTMTDDKIRRIAHWVRGEATNSNGHLCVWVWPFEGQDIAYVFSIPADVRGASVTYDVWMEGHHGGHGEIGVLADQSPETIATVILAFVDKATRPDPEPADESIGF